MTVTTPPAKHSAPGQYLGFALQSVRLCYHLLTCAKGARVSLEYLDDIAVHAPDGSVTLEQTKSALKQNPLSDWAIDLWKAIANWLEFMAKGDANIQIAGFRIYVTPMKTGKRAQALSDASTLADVEAITQAIRADLAKMKKPPACMPFLQQFLDATDEDRSAVITRLKIVSSEDDPIDPLRALLELTVPSAIIDLICESTIGLAKEQADRLLRSGKQAILSADDFRAGFRAFVQKNNLPGYLASFTTPPASGEVEHLLSTRPTFIRQLELIEASADECSRAVSDYLRTSADKSIWAEAGLIFEQGLKDWDDDLVRRHSHIDGEIADIHSDKAAHIRGRIVYRRCAQLEAPLNGRAVPGHFVHGCLNDLSDLRRLGWHPQFAALLDKSEK